MARPFGKQPYEWQRLPKTISLITTAKKDTTGKSLSLIYTERGHYEEINMDRGIALELTTCLFNQMSMLLMLREHLINN